MARKRTPRRRANGEGTLFYEKARRRWRVSFELPDGTPRTATGPSAADAIARRDKVLAEIRAKEAAVLPSDDTTTTVGEYLAWWRDNVLPEKGRSSRTVANYAWAIDTHLIPALGKERLGHLRPEQVEALLSRMVRKGAARNSVMRVRSVLSMALQTALARGRVSRNAGSLAVLPHAARRPKEGRSLTHDEAKALLEAAKGHRLEALVVTDLMLGLRPGEVLGLHWEDVDLDAGVLRVTHALIQEPNGAVRRGEPKTRRSRRELALPEPVVAALRVHQRRTGAIGGYVFGGTRPGRPMDQSQLRKALAELTEAAGLGRWTPQELRHSAASLLSAAGVPLEQVADTLGHVDTRMLERVYRHRTTPVVTAAVVPMNELFG